MTLLTLTPFSPIPPYTSILPLVVVLTISAVSAAIEDLRRYRSDRAVNTAPFYVLQPGAPRWNLQEIKSEDIKVGSLLYLGANTLHHTTHSHTSNRGWRLASGRRSAAQDVV